MTGSNCKTIGIFDSCSWQWMQGLLWHLPEPFSWEISENNNCQLHTGKQLKAAGVGMLTPKGFVNKHLLCIDFKVTIAVYSALGFSTFCQTVNIGTKGPRLAEEESSANRRSACPCVNFSRKRAILCIFWSYTAKFKLQVIQDAYKGQQNMFFQWYFVENQKYADMNII